LVPTLYGPDAETVIVKPAMDSGIHEYRIQQSVLRIKNMVPHELESVNTEHLAHLCTYIILIAFSSGLAHLWFFTPCEGEHMGAVE
jgi:hypothetical protein